MWKYSSFELKPSILSSFDALHSLCGLAETQKWRVRFSIIYGMMRHEWSLITAEYKSALRSQKVGSYWSIGIHSWICICYCLLSNREDDRVDLATIGGISDRSPILWLKGAYCFMKWDRAPATRGNSASFMLSCWNEEVIGQILQRLYTCTRISFLSLEFG